MFYRVFRAFLRLCFRLFYRRIEVPGLDSIPRTGPLLLTANHGNALIDPMLLIAMIPRRISFLAKHTLFSMPVIGFFIRRIGGLPVYRKQDAPLDMSRNEETLEACRRILEAGGAVCLFPEGKSHDQPRLQPLRTGAARIFCRVAPSRRPDTRIIPVGINFEKKSGVRSRVLIMVGKALGLHGPPRRDEPAPTVGEWTRRIDDALRSLVPGVDSWEELRFVREIEQLYLGNRGESLRREAPVLRRFIDAYQRFRKEDPESVREIRQGWEGYRRQLARFSLTAAQVDLAGAPLRAARFLVASGGVILLVLPLALFGLITHFLPFQLCRWIENRFNRHPDQAATVKFLAGLALFPLTYLVVMSGVLIQGGLALSLAIGALLPISGWAALLVRENRQRLRESARALSLVWPGGRALRELRRQRAQILERVTVLVRREVSALSKDDDLNLRASPK